MRFTKLIALAFLGVPSFCATVDNIKADAEDIGAVCVLNKNAANSFPTAIGIATPLALNRILTASASLATALKTFIFDLHNLDTPITEADGIAVLAGLRIAGPNCIQALDFLIARKAALTALLVTGGTAIDAVRVDLQGILPLSHGFKAALADALKDPSQAAEWNAVAQAVIDKQADTVLTLL